MTSKPPIPYEKAIGAFNDSERPSNGEMARARAAAAEMDAPDESMYSDDPAWPRFSIWPSRLRRGGRQ